MIDHVSLGVADLARARAFYDAALSPLGYRRGANLDDASGYGEPGLVQQALPFWIGRDDDVLPWAGHLCFRAPSRDAVRGFYHAALGAGARDNGEPGLRPQYHDHYYAAFVIDPDGYRIEAVCHHAE